MQSYIHSPCRFLASIALVLLLGLVAPASQAQDAVLVVDHASQQADDANPGTTDKPFKTITAAIAKAGPGSTVLVKGGIYRESVTLKKSGEKDRPLTIKAMPGERVVVSGADPVCGWKRCSKDDAPGCENYDKLYMADLAKVPDHLIESSSRRVAYKIARLPAEGMWQPEAAVGRRSFSDAVHLTATNANAYAGWTLNCYYNGGGGASPQPVFTYDPQQHQITLPKDWSNYADINPQRDTYWFENHPAGIDRPGRYAYQKTDKGWRCWIWPTVMAGDQPAVESLVRDNCLTLYKGGHWVVDGLELGFARGYAVFCDTLTDSTIQNCYLHDCFRTGINLLNPTRMTVRRTVIREVNNGIVISGPHASEIVIEENDIGWCLVDGMDIAEGVSNLHIERNFIHDNFRYGHPDNIQWWGEISGVWVRDNVLLNAGQLTIGERGKDMHVINNLMIGSHAVGSILAGDSGGPVYTLPAKPDDRNKAIEAFESCAPDGYEIVHNTICATGLSPTSWGGTGFAISNNVIAPLHAAQLYYINSLRTASVDYNLLSAFANTPPHVTIATIVKKEEGNQTMLNMKMNRDVGLAVLQEKFGLEKHGVAADPQFINAPKFYAVSHYGWISASTRGKLVLWTSAVDSFAVGDHIEIAFDGVCRTVSEVGTAGKEKYVTIAFNPPLKDLCDFPLSVANWGDKTNLTWNLKLKETSPGHNTASDGKDMGSSLSLQNYMKGDFHGDGTRLLPVLPKE